MTMRKALIVVSIVVILLAAGAWWLFSVPAAAAAVLYVDEGTVEVDVGKGWMQGADEMELSQGAKVRTRDGAASVIMLDGEVMSLGPNTEVSLSEVSPQGIIIQQLAGETWHKVTKVSGVPLYEVATPTTVATVRGTEFFVSVGEEDEVVVEEGEIEVGFVDTPSKKLHMGPTRKMRMQKQLDKMIEEEWSDDPRAAKFKEKYIKHLKKARMREIKRHDKLMGMAKKQYGITDQQIEQYLSDVDEGKEDEDKAFEQVPAPLKKKAERTYKITKAIKKAKEKQVNRQRP